MTIRIKAFESEYSESLETIVNDFLEILETEPIKMTFGNSFHMAFDGDYEGDYSYYPTYTAIIEYIATPGNIEAVAAYDDTIG